MSSQRLFGILILSGVVALARVPCEAWGAQLVVGQNYYSVQLQSSASASALQESLALVADQPYSRIDQRGGGYALRVGYWETRTEAVQAAGALSAKFVGANVRIATYRPDAIVAWAREQPPNDSAPMPSTPDVPSPSVASAIEQPSGAVAPPPSKPDAQPPRISSPAQQPSAAIAPLRSTPAILPPPMTEPAQLPAQTPVLSREPQQDNAELGRHLEYQLGAGDTIRIVVYQNADLTLETRVTENGTITFPLIGTVKIGGLTIGAAEQVIAKALKGGGFIQSPQVNIVLLQNSGNQVSVLGQVNHPGRFPLGTLNVRVSEMLAIAGGISATGADVAVLTGVREGKAFRVEIDISGMFLNNKLQDDLVVSSGDVIYVHRMPQFYIYGETQRAGSYRVERGMTVGQALAQGGGPTGRGTERSLRLNRRGADGKVEILSPSLNDPVRADDVIYVNESMFYIYGEAQRAGSYRVERGMTVRQALAQGGGPTVRGTERRLRLYRHGADGNVETLSPTLDDLVHADDVIYVNESIF